MVAFADIDMPRSQRQVGTLRLAIEFSDPMAQRGESAQLQPERFEWKPSRIILE
jgi:hypothetical protein